MCFLAHQTCNKTQRKDELVEHVFIVTNLICHAKMVIVEIAFSYKSKLALVSDVWSEELDICVRIRILESEEEGRELICLTIVHHPHRLL
jgi:hypothetical protein